DGELAALTSETLESTAFALASGQVSGVVESEFGFHILRVSDVSGNDLASQKEKLLAQIKEKKANTAYNKLRDDFADASFNQAEALKPSADKFGLTVQNSNDWVTRKSNDVPAAVLEVLFSEDMKTKKHNSDAIVVQGKTWFVRVLEARAEANQAFDAVKDKVKTDFVANESQRLAKAEAEKMLADLRAGKKVELAWSPVQAVVPQQIQAAMPADAYAQFMSAVPKNGQPAFALLNMQPALQLVEVQKIEAFGSDNPLLPQAKKFALQNNSNNLIEAFIDGMRSQIKTKQGLQTLNHEE
ncbi:MAG: peptidylprolyl isomerase, partial [Neisseriaceae bacterium]|nr:peptidylprolyl isomerase [Neisseriaceae bacterium]